MSDVAITKQPARTDEIEGALLKNAGTVLHDHASSVFRLKKIISSKVPCLHVCVGSMLG